MCVCVCFLWLLSSPCLFIFISMHMFVFSIVCADLFYSFTKSVSHCVSACLFLPSSVGRYSPEPRSTLLLSCCCCSALARAQNIPIADLNCHFHGAPRASLFFSPSLLFNLPLCCLLNYSIFQTCTLDSTCATKSSSEWHGEISRKFQRTVIVVA